MRRMQQFRKAAPKVLRCCFVLGLVYIAPLFAASQAAANQVSKSQTNSGIEEKKLDLDREKLAFEKTKHKDEIDQKKQDSHNDLVKIIVSAASLGIPLIVAIIGFWVEARNRRKNEEIERASREQNETLQFQLKAAEIALDVRNSAEIQPKAAALAQLFPKRLPNNFAKDFDPEAIRFGPPITESKIKLLELLAQYPNERTNILRIWGHMFPGDTGKKKSDLAAYLWFNAILDDEMLDKDQTK